MRGRNLVLAAAVALASMLLAGSAAAAKAETEIGDVEVEVAGAEAKYSGTIDSKKSRCLKNRRVVLIHDSDPPFEIGETRTDRNGRWKITGPYPSDPRDARIIIKVAANRKCKAAKAAFDFFEDAEDRIRS